MSVVHNGLRGWMNDEPRSKPREYSAVGRFTRSRTRDPLDGRGVPSSPLHSGRGVCGLTEIGPDPFTVLPLSDVASPRALDDTLSTTGLGARQATRCRHTVVRCALRPVDNTLHSGRGVSAVRQTLCSAARVSNIDTSCQPIHSGRGVPLEYINRQTPPFATATVCSPSES